MVSVTFHPQALHEYQQAIDWYMQRNPQAAQQFVLEVERVVMAIATQPELYGWYQVPYREAGLRRYPYSVVYRIEPSGDVLIMAVAHTSREPDYWQRRT